MRLIGKIHNTSFHINTRLGFMLLGFGIMLWFCGAVYELGGYGIKENFSFPVSVAGFILLAVGIFQTKRIDLKAFGVAALGLLYISLSWGLMLNLYNEIDFILHDTRYIAGGYFIPIAIIASIWINDTMAYIVGSLIGKTPIAKISPKKTWEGTLGGIFLSIVIVGLISFYILKLEELTFHLVLIALIASIAGTFGDLLESKLKRMAGVKDSGNFMPGHGGFLDRFDSMLLAIPAVWLYVKIIL